MPAFGADAVHSLNFWQTSLVELMTEKHISIPPMGTLSDRDGLVRELTGRSEEKKNIYKEKILNFYYILMIMEISALQPHTAGERRQGSNSHAGLGAPQKTKLCVP